MEERKQQHTAPPICRTGASPTKEIKKTVKMAETCDFIPYETDESDSAFGFTARSPPDVTSCIGSSDAPCEQMQDTPDYIRRGAQRHRIAPIELFSAPSPQESPLKSHPPAKNVALEASLKDGVIPDIGEHMICINAGGMEEAVSCDSAEFQGDSFYVGGEVTTTDADVETLYRSARLGDSLYKFDSLGEGGYLVDLHFAEIVFTDGPPGMRVFDVFMQEEKVVSGLDIYAKVGANRPLVLTDIRASVVEGEGLSIRFEGIVGRPIVCAISIRRDPSAGKKENLCLPSGKNEERLNTEEGKCNSCTKLKQEYDLLSREQEKCRRVLEDLKRENEFKSKECHEAQTSLQELKMELMRKSMHVGSLAFAVEGQVKEKSRWCLSLRDLSEKFKLLKLEHQRLLEESQEYKKCAIDATQMTTTIQQAMNRYINLEGEFKDLKQKFIEEAKGRKDLYNKLIELKGNIRVFCRCRPLNVEEIAEGASMAIDFESARDGELIVRGHVSSKKVFRFDSVFNPEEDQEKVFEKTAPFATSVLDGYNVCIFAYGQTGTGKTFTMEGIEGARGVNYRTLEELFRIIIERQGLFQYEVTVSVLEVYNEQIHDLLLSGSQPGATARRLEVKQVAEGVHHVPGLVEARVSNMNEAWEVLQTGSKARVVGSTNANEHSSRSHCMHCVMVRGENLMNGECTKSKLWLIDLAGSERVAKTDAQGERLKEAQNINKSLSALGDVISALATKSQHIPFRNSKLTHLLQDSLSGDSKTLMFVQISPNENDAGETLCSLNFASRVRGIELGQARKQVDVGELSRYKLMAGRAKQDNKNKDAQIKSMEETIQSLEMKNKARDLLTMNLQEKIKELESQLLVERKIARQHVDNKIAQDHLQLQQEQEQQQTAKEENSFLRNPMSERNHNSAVEQAAAPKDFGSAKQLFADNNGFRTMPSPPTGDHSFRQLLYAREKENNPEISEEVPQTKARRVSLCNTAYQHPTNAGSRRNSLIPLPRRNSLVPLPVITRPAAAQLDKITENFAPPFCSPPLVSNEKGRNSKKVSSILRRSLQKKVIIRPPMPQSGRRGGAAAAAQGVESGRKARRVPVSSVPQRQQHRDKERGWNTGTSLRHNF